MYSVIPVIRQTPKIFSVAFYSRQTRTRRKRPEDPGLRYQTSLYKNEKFENYEDIEDLELDFQGLEMTHKEHVQEVETMKKKEKYHIVGQKYFKNKTPNFLTWSDKEQIRLLYKTDPEKWSPETLSEAFPALPDVIKKIIKSNWTLQHTAVYNHDRSVHKNWQDFESGKLQHLPKNLAAHLVKFTGRKQDLIAQTTSLQPTKVIVDKDKSKPLGEFSSIVISYENLKSKSDVNIPSAESEQSFRKDTENFGKWDKHSKHTTLAGLQDKIEERVKSGHDVNENEMFILKQAKSEQYVGEQIIELPKQQLAVENKYHKSEVVTDTSKSSQHEYSFLVYPLQISIPSKLYKKGSLYKLSDCYYNDKGHFLYRVPGMEG